MILYILNNFILPLVGCFTLALIPCFFINCIGNFEETTFNKILIVISIFIFCLNFLSTYRENKYKEELKYYINNAESLESLKDTLDEKELLQFYNEITKDK